MNPEPNPYEEAREADLNEEADRYQEWADEQLVAEHKKNPERFARVRLYPDWVCEECGTRYGSRKCGIATWHPDTCGVCNKHCLVTEPRDFGHLRNNEWRNHPPTNHHVK